MRPNLADEPDTSPLRGLALIAAALGPSYTRKRRDRAMRIHSVQMINRKVRLMVGTGMCVAAFASAAGAEELPGLRSGLWEFKRTVEGASAEGTAQTLVNQKCTDPTADMR